MWKDRITVFALLSVLNVGCDVPALVFWSPDGTRAVYMAPSCKTGGTPVAKAQIIDEKGEILGTFYSALGQVAWSGDSKRVYFSEFVSRPLDEPRPRVEMKLSNMSTTQAAACTQPAPFAIATRYGLARKSENEDWANVVSYYADGRVTPLFKIPRGTPTLLAVSQAGFERKDDCVVAVVDGAVPGVQQNRRQCASAIYLYHMPTRRLFLISAACQNALWLQARQLMYIEADALRPDNSVSESGRIVSMDIDHFLRDQRAHRPMDWETSVMVRDTAWVGSCAAGYLVTSKPTTLPADTRPRAEAYTLFSSRFLGEASWTPLVEHVGPYAIPSPDGKLVLIEVVQFDGTFRSSSDLAVLKVQDGTVHTLVRGITVRDSATADWSGIPVVPAWRGNREICFIAPVDVYKPVIRNDRIHYELALYRLTDQLKLEFIRTLSERWPAEMKPGTSRERSDHLPNTEPPVK